MALPSIEQLLGPKPVTIESLLGSKPSELKVKKFVRPETPKELGQLQQPEVKVEVGESIWERFSRLNPSFRKRLAGWTLGKHPETGKRAWFKKPFFAKPIPEGKDIRYTYQWEPAEFKEIKAEREAQKYVPSEKIEKWNRAVEKADPYLELAAGVLYLAYTGKTIYDINRFWRLYDSLKKVKVTPQQIENFRQSIRTGKGTPEWVKGLTGEERRDILKGSKEYYFKWGDVNPLFTRLKNLFSKKPTIKAEVPKEIKGLLVPKKEIPIKEKPELVKAVSPVEVPKPIRPKKEVEKSLTLIVKEAGGIKPSVDFPNLTKDVTVGVVRKTGRSIDDLATELESMGLWKMPRDRNPADALVEALKLEKGKRVVPIEKVKREVPIKELAAGELETGQKVLIEGKWNTVTKIPEKGQIVLQDGRKKVYDPFDLVKVEYRAPAELGIKKPAMRIEKTPAGEQYVPIELRPQAEIPKGKIEPKGRVKPVEGREGIGMFKTEEQIRQEELFKAKKAKPLPSIKIPEEKPVEKPKYQVTIRKDIIEPYRSKTNKPELVGDEQYFIRFTNTPVEDLERGYSSHLSSYDKSTSKADVASELGVNIEDLFLFKNRWAQRYEGISGFGLDARNIKGAENEIKLRWDEYRVYNALPYKIYKGEVTDVDVPDGLSFEPIAIVDTIKTKSVFEDLTIKAKPLPSIKIPEEKPIVKEPKQPAMVTDFERISGIEAKPEGKPTGKAAIVKEIERTLNEPIRAGLVRQTAAMRKAGIYKVKPGVIRTVTANDIEVIAHETGHAIQKHIFGSVNPKEKGFHFDEKDKQSKIIKELQSLDYEPKRKRTSEGFAEYIRHYVNSESEAKKVAPTFHDTFEKYMEDKNPELLEMLQSARNDWAKWRNQPGVQQVLSQISKSKKEIGIPTLEKIYTQAMDDLTPINLMIKDLKLAKSLNIVDDPYIGARLMRGWEGICQHFFDKGTLNAKREIIGKPLNEILKQIDDLDNLRVYLVSKRALELKERFPNKSMEQLTGLQENKVQDALRELESPKMQEIAKLLYKYQDDTLKFLVEHGILSKEIYDKIKVVNQYYVPFYRVMDDAVEIQRRFGGRTYANLYNPIRAIKGSGREIVDPLESIIKNTYAAVNLSLRNKIGLQIADMAGVKGAGKWVEKVPTSMVVTKVSLDEINKALKGEFGNIDDFEEAFINIFRPSKFKPQPNHIFVFREGKREYYQLHPELYKAVMSLSSEQFNWLIKTLSVPAKTLRAGATLTPEFMGRNPIRDIFSAMVYSKAVFVPTDFVRGIFHLIKKDDLYWQWKAAGGDHSMLVSMDRAYLKQKMKGMLWPKYKRIIRKLINPLDLLRALSEATEAGTRLGEFHKVIQQEVKSYEGLLRAGYAAREVTLDFSRKGGHLVRDINKITAFFNAQLQGVDKLIRTFYTNPSKAFLRALTVITLPSIALWLINHDDEDYQDLPRWQKDFFWIVPMPEWFKKVNWFGDSFMRLPKPFELGLIFGSLPERILDYAYEQDKKAMKEWIKSAKEALLPDLLPTGIKPILENMRNRSYFFDSPVVPPYLNLEKIDEKLKVKVTTSETAKLLGELINQSPAKIENIFYGYFAGLGRHITNITDKAVIKVKGIDIPELPERGFSKWPLLKGFIARYPTANTRWIVYFYNEYDKIQIAYNTWRKLGRTDRDKADKYKLKHDNLISQYPEYKGMASLLNAMRQRIGNIYDDEKLTASQKRIQIDNIYRTMSKLTKEKMK